MVRTSGCAGGAGGCTGGTGDSSRGITGGGWGTGGPPSATHIYVVDCVTRNEFNSISNDIVTNGIWWITKSLKQNCFMSVLWKNII